MEFYEIIIGILSGLTVAIPLVVKLVEWVQKAVKEKNWGQLLTLIMNLMAEAENMFDNGADRKQWVIAMVQASAKTINYPITEKELSDLIDDLVALTNKVNVKIEEVKENFEEDLI